MEKVDSRSQRRVATTSVALDRERLEQLNDSDLGSLRTDDSYIEPLAATSNSVDVPEISELQVWQSL